LCEGRPLEGDEAAKGITSPEGEAGADADPADPCVGDGDLESPIMRAGEACRVVNDSSGVCGIVAAFFFFGEGCRENSVGFSRRLRRFGEGVKPSIVDGTNFALFVTDNRGLLPESEPSCSDGSTWSSFIRMAGILSDDKGGLKRASAVRTGDFRCVHEVRRAFSAGRFCFVAGDMDGPATSLFATRLLVTIVTSTTLDMLFRDDGAEANGLGNLEGDRLSSSSLLSSRVPSSTSSYSFRGSVEVSVINDVRDFLP
jgi:hypothetical protein